MKREPNFKREMVKVSAQIPVSEERALKQQAEDEGRSLASEIRMAIHDRLKKNGRVL
jgi:hypothetical protein